MSAYSATHPHPGGAWIRLDRELVLVVSAVVVGAIMSILDVTLAGDAIKALAREIQAEPSTIRWVVTGYALMLGTLLPPAVWADRLATKRLHLISIMLYLLGSILLGLAWQRIFLINVPVGAVALLMTALMPPPNASRQLATAGAARRQQRVLAAFLGGRLPAGRLDAELALAMKRA